MNSTRKGPSPRRLRVSDCFYLRKAFLLISRFENSVGSGLVFERPNVAPEIVYLRVKDQKAFLDLLNRKPNVLQDLDQVGVNVERVFLTGPGPCAFHYTYFVQGISVIAVTRSGNLVLIATTLGTKLQPPLGP